MQIIYHLDCLKVQFNTFETCFLLAAFCSFRAPLTKRTRRRKNMFHTFRKLTPADKFAAAAAATITVSGSVAFLVNFIVSTDTVQKVHIKHELLNMKYPKPPHIDKVNNNFNCPQ